MAVLARSIASVLKLSLRNLLAHKLRFLMTTFAVVLGVAFVVGSFVLTDSLRAAIGGLLTDIGQGVDVVVQPKSDIDGMGSVGLLDPEIVDLVSEVEGVEYAEGAVTGNGIVVVDKDGEPLTTLGAPQLGVNWTDVDQLNPLQLVDGGPPEGPNEIAIDRSTAEDAKLEVGDETTVILPSGPREVTIAGVFSFGEANSLLGARLTAFDPDVALEAVGLDGYAQVQVVAAEGVSTEELAERLAAVLPEGAEALTGEQSVQDSIDQTEQFVGIFQNALLGFAGVALFVSAFYINNTFAIVLGQRVREMALLRALGAGARQLRISVFLESLVIGLLASLLGIVGGLGVGSIIRAALEQVLDFPDQGLVIKPRTWLAAFLVGVVVTVLSAIAPARRASKVAPVEGMREGVLAHQSSTRRLIVGGLALAIGIALVALGLYSAEGGSQIFGMLAVGALLIFLGVAGVSPVIAVPVIRVLGAPMARFRGKPGALARSNAMRTPDRTARTAAALMIGLALVTTVYVVGDSFKTSFANSVRKSVRADYVITSDGGAGLHPATIKAVTELPQIAASSGARFDRLFFEGEAKDLVAMDAQVLPQVLDIEVVDGSLDDLEGDAIFIHEDVAEDEGLGVGDQVDVQFAAGGPQTVTVAGIHSDATYVGNFLIDIEKFTEVYPTNTDDFFLFLRSAEGVDEEDLRAAVDEATELLPPIKLETRAEFQASQEAQIDQLLAVVNALLGLALIIALLGIANTLALSVIERTREIGLLRAVGMTRKQTRRMIRYESILVAVFGAALGVIVGLLFGLAAAAAMPESVVNTISVPIGSLIVIVIVAGLFGVLAGWLPARRAAKLDVLRSLSME